MLTVFLGFIILFLSWLLYDTVSKDKPKPRFVLHPGYRRLSEGPYEFLGIQDLIDLYGLNPKEDWIIEYNSKTYLHRTNDIWLYPLHDWQDPIIILTEELNRKNLKR